MKRLLPLLFVLCWLPAVRAQELTYAQGGLSYTKGNINTEVLVGLIQEKQKELNKFVLSNMILKGGLSSGKKGTNSRLDNFTTKYLIYKTMNDLILAENKTKFGKNTLELLKEASLVYGLSVIVKSEFTVQVPLAQKDNDTSQAGKKDMKIDRAKIEDTIDFNLTMDMVLNYCITNPEINQYFPVYSQIIAPNNPDKEWYESDSRYMQMIDTAWVQAQYQHDTTRIGRVYRLIYSLRDGIHGKVTIDSVLNHGFFSKVAEIGIGKQLSPELKKMLLKMDSLVKPEMDALHLARIPASVLQTASSAQTGSGITKALQVQLTNAAEHYDLIRSMFVAFMTLREPDGINEYTFDYQQLNATKELLYTFVSYLQKSDQFNASSVYLRTVLDNITINRGSKKRDSLTVSLNFESVLFELNDRLVTPYRLKRYRVVEPYLNIGLNYASFINPNSLGEQVNGLPGTLKGLSFASEKIGVKFKLWNYRYTRSFAPGVVFRYHGSERYWLRPQPKSMIDDVFLDAHTGGLLYNMVNLKTDRNFNFPFVGVGAGVRTFNGLTISGSINSPFTQNTWSTRNLFVMFSLDIPIIEYIAKLKN